MNLKDYITTRYKNNIVKGYMEKEKEKVKETERKKRCYWCRVRYRRIGMLCRQCKIHDYEMWIRDIQELIDDFPEEVYEE